MRSVAQSSRVAQATEDQKKAVESLVKSAKPDINVNLQHGQYELAKIRAVNKIMDKANDDKRAVLEAKVDEWKTVEANIKAIDAQKKEQCDQLIESKLELVD